MSEHSHGRHGHGGSHSTKRNVVSYVFSFFLSVALLLLMVVAVLRVGVFSDSGFTSMLDDAYYSYTLEYIEDEANYYTLPTGIDPAVLEGVFTSAEVHTDVDAFISTAFNGVSYEPDTTAARERLTNNVRAAFASDGVVMGESGEAASEDIESIITAYVDDIMKIYVEAVKMPGMDAIVQVYNLFIKYFVFALVGLLVFAALMVFLIMRLHRFPHRGLRYVAYATGGAALMGFVVPFIAYRSGFYKGIGLSPQYFYHFGVSLISRVLLLCMLGAAVLLVATIVLILVIRYMRAHLKMHHTH